MMTAQYAQDKCPSRCSHGGWCTRDRHHTGKHKTEYCKWTDAQALTIADADKVYAETTGDSTFTEFGRVLGAWE